MQSLLVEETLRRWTPPEDLSRNLGIPRPQTDAELQALIWQYLGIRIPDTPVTPGRSTPFRALAEAYFARTPVAVWKGARALAGKTFTLAVLSWLEAVTLRCDVSLLGGSQDQSDLVHEYMRKFWRKPSVPIGALMGEPGTSRTKLIWGNTIRALAASQTKARGGHPPRLRLDEVDEMDFKIYEAIMGQPMKQDDVESQVVISSTQQYTDKTMAKVLAQAQESGWSVHEWGYNETLEPHGWLTQKEVARKRSQMTAESWRVEVELGEPSAEGRAIDTAKVERMFTGPLIPNPPAAGTEFPYREFEPPVPGASYATGADWARTRDYVEIVTLRDDVWPLRLVAYQRFRKRAFPYIRAAAERQLGRYPGTLGHDRTSMGGLFMEDLLDKPREDSIVEGFTMSGVPRQDLFTDYIIGIETEAVVSPRIDVLYRQHKFVTNDDLRPSGTGHPPDGFVAASLAWHYSNAAKRELSLVSGGETKLEQVAGGKLPALGYDGTAPPPAYPTSPLGKVLSLFGPNGNGHKGATP